MTTKEKMLFDMVPKNDRAPIIIKAQEYIRCAQDLQFKQATRQGYFNMAHYLICKWDIRLNEMIN